MAKTRSEKSKYLSKYSAPGEPEYLDDNKYLIEVILERVAKRDGKTLPTRYWRSPEWLKEFKANLRHTKYYLDKYNLQSVLDALKHRRAAKVYSLGLKSVLEPLCQEAQQRRDAQDKVAAQTTVDILDIDVNAQPRKPMAKTNIRNL